MIGTVTSFIFWCALSYAAGWFSSRFRPGAWYASLDKPPWTPPVLAFPIVWALLYALMGVAAAMVWNRRAESPAAAPAITLFLVQLLLNALWSWIFFGRHQMGWALVEIVALWAAIAATLLAFARVHPPAAWLLAPYLAWVTTAVALNASIWRRN